MIIPNLFSLTASILVLYLFFRKDIPRSYDVTQLKVPRDAIKDEKMFRLSWLVLAILLIGYFLSEFAGIPVSIVAGSIAVVFLLLGRGSSAVEIGKVIKGAPWDIVFFSLGMYVVVYGLRNVGLTDMLAGVLNAAADQGLLLQQ